MPGLDQFIQKLQVLSDSLEDIVLDAMDTAALDSIALLQRRIQEEGKDAEGNAWRPYSEEYEKYKEKEGKTGNGLVNFTFSGRMMNNIGIVAKTKGQIVTVTVRPRSEENQLKMQGLSYGIPAEGRPASKRKTKSGKTVDVGAYFHPGTKGRGRIMDISNGEVDNVRMVFIENVFTDIKTILR
jgi:hypothetical protein